MFLNTLKYVQKHIKQSTYAQASEIQHRRLLDGVVHPNDLPEVLPINRRLREDLLFSEKQLMVSPLEVEKPRALDRENDYLQSISRYLDSKLHFFDESSVIKTTGSDKYCRRCLL